MALDYAQTATDADAALREVGAEVTVTKVTDGAYDNDTATIPQTTATETAYGVILPDTGQHFFTAEGLRVMHKALAYVSPLKTDATELTAPAPGDTVTIDGRAWTIERVKTYSPTGTPVLHICGVT